MHALARRLEQATGVAIEILKADLTSPADLARVEARLREDQCIGVLVNNAGMAAHGSFAEPVWERSGRDANKLGTVIDVDEMVDAALVGFAQREAVTLPSLPNVDQWHAFDAARRAMLPNFGNAHAAERYSKLQLCSGRWQRSRCIRKARLVRQPETQQQIQATMGRGFQTRDGALDLGRTLGELSGERT